MKTKLIAGIGTLIVLAFLLLPTFALAQTTSTARVPPPACWPSQIGGSGSKAVRVTSDYGQAIMWWCGQESVGFVASWAYTLTIPDKLPSNTLDAIKLMWEANVTNEQIDPVERRLLTQDALIALQPLRPVEPTWLVAPNGTNSTRPVYSYTERTVADQSKQIVLDPTTVRATVGKPCNCAALRYAPSTVTYCLIPSASLTAATTVLKPVAVCRLQ